MTAFSVEGIQLLTTISTVTACEKLAHYHLIDTSTACYRYMFNESGDPVFGSNAYRLVQNLVEKTDSK